MIVRVGRETALAVGAARLLLTSQRTLTIGAWWLASVDVASAVGARWLLTVVGVVVSERANTVAVGSWEVSVVGVHSDWLKLKMWFDDMWRFLKSIIKLGPSWWCFVSSNSLGIYTRSPWWATQTLADERRRPELNQLARRRWRRRHVVDMILHQVIRRQLSWQSNMIKRNKPTCWLGLGSCSEIRFQRIWFDTY